MKLNGILAGIALAGAVIMAVPGYALAALDTVQATELLIDRLKNTKSNDEFLRIVDKTLRDGQV